MQLNCKKGSYHENLSYLCVCVCVCVCGGGGRVGGGGAGRVSLTIKFV